MSRVIRIARVFALFLSTLSPALAATDLHDADATFAAFETSQQHSYAATNAEYRAALAAAPDDPALAIAQCQFIGNFSDAEDINWNDGASEDLEQCQLRVGKQWPKSPEVRVYQLESGLDDLALADADTTWRDATAWPKPLRVRLAVRIQQLYRQDDNEADAGRFAVISAKLGDARSLPKAIAYLAGRGEDKQAIELTLGSKPADSGWQAEARIKALATLRDKSVARRELERSLKAGLELSAASRVNAYLGAGDLAAANRAARGLDNQRGPDKTARFALALANGQLAAARALVNFDDDFSIWVQRYSTVVAKAPLAAFGVTLLPFTLTLLGVLAMATLLPALLLLPVHYT